MKALLQTGSSGRVPVPREKRFLINGLAFAEILVLLVALAATLIAFWRVRRAAALLLIPYALWAAFATVLNFTIWRMNG